MKKLRTVIILLLTLGIVGTAFASVGTLPGSGWWTSVGMQNVGSSIANVVMTAYHVNGGSAATYTGSFTMTVGGSVTFLPGSSAPNVDVTPPLPSGFQGSMVVSSDQPLVAIGQVGNNVLLGGALGVTGGYASAQYRGSNQGATSLSYPTVKSNFSGKTTTFYIQAAGSDTTVTATIKTNDGASHTASMAVAANKTWVASPGDFSPAISSSSCGSNPNTSPCVGSFSASTSGGQIVGAVVEHQTSTSPATIAQSTALFLPSDAATTVYCPTFKNGYAGGTAPRNTGLTVQNTSGGAATVYLTLKSVATGLVYHSSAVVAGGASVTFNPQAANIGGFPSGGGGTADGLAAATVTSTVQLIANVNEANQLGTPVKATTYSCFGASGATAKVALPQVKEEFVGSNTGVSIQNTDVTTATVSAVYTCGGVAYTHINKLLAPGAAYTYFRPHTSAGNWTGTALPNNKLCAVVVTTGGQKIVGIAQEAAYPSGNLDTKNYEGFNVN
jgi:hypothetical protein